MVDDEDDDEGEDNGSVSPTGPTTSDLNGQKLLKLANVKCEINIMNNTLTICLSLREGLTPMPYE